MTTVEPPGETKDRAADDAAIRRVVADFAAAWNRHDPVALVEDFADDLDHVSVGGRWQQGRAELEQTYRTNHAGIWQAVTTHRVVEGIRYLRPDVAVAIVRGTLESGEAKQTARATWVLTKDDGRWRCRAFQQTYLQDIPIAPHVAEPTSSA